MNQASSLSSYRQHLLTTTPPCINFGSRYVRWSAPAIWILESNTSRNTLLRDHEYFQTSRKINYLVSPTFAFTSTFASVSFRHVNIILNTRLQWVSLSVIVNIGYQGRPSLLCSWRILPPPSLYPSSLRIPPLPFPHHSPPSISPPSSSYHPRKYFEFVDAR